MAIFSFRSDKDSRGAVLNPSVETDFKLYLQSLYGTYYSGRRLYKYNEADF